MNAALFVHQVDVERAERATVDGKLTTAWTSVETGLRCLVSTLKSYQKDSMLGRLDGAHYRMTWMSGDVKNGDRVTWDDRTWIVRDLSKDNASPWFSYYTAVLVETK